MVIIKERRTTQIVCSYEEQCIKELVLNLVSEAGTPVNCITIFSQNKYKLMN